MKLFMIDGVGPFFKGYRRHRINWSKIPFHHLERAGSLDKGRLPGVRDEFKRFVASAAAVGFNGVTLDDVAHLAPHPAYDPPTARRIEAYRVFFGSLFATAVEHGMTPFLTTDIMYFHPAWAREVRDLHRDITPLLQDALDRLFADFPTLGGVIMRMGECDGKDAITEFPSRLVIHRPSQLNRFIKAMLPVFEGHHRLMIFRTWSVGAYPIGDLMWNRTTFDRAFANVVSPNFIISMKHGESDFFRYLPLNKLFFRSEHRKIVELQSKREYEGFGEYPSFIGWDYENVRRQLTSARNMVGIQVWCQTGGWSGFRRRTFLERRAVWNDVNTHVTVKLFRDDLTTEEAVRRFCNERLGHDRWTGLLVLLRLSDEIVKELLYVDEFARRKVFFRRLRVPPLLAVFWDHVIVTHSMRKLLRCFVTDGEQKIVQGYSALRKITVMRELAGDLGLPVDDFDFQYATFEILAAAREYYFGSYTYELAARMKRMKAAYRAAFSTTYCVHLDFARFSMSRRRLKLFLAILLRTKRGYRIIDRVVMIRLLNLISPLLRLTSHRRALPRFAREQAMGIDALLK